MNRVEYLLIMWSPMGFIKSIRYIFYVLVVNCFDFVGGHFYIPMAIYISMANECHCILNTNSCEVHFNKLGITSMC